MTSAAPHVLTFVVPDAARSIRFDVFLSRLATTPDIDPHVVACLADFSRARLQQLISDGDVTLDGRPVRPSAKLRGRETVTVTVPAPAPSVLAPHPMSLEILYEDQDMLVLNKAAGVLVHPGAGRPEPTLVHGLLAHCGDLSGIGGVLRPGIVHRLDAGTSGLLVVAKNDAAHVGLARQFAARTVHKRYVAVVYGVPEPAEFTIDTWYARHPTQRRRFTSRVAAPPPGSPARAGVRRARTTYRVLGSGGGLSVVDILLGTGRTHQIRVHFSDRGHPLVGDSLYAGRQFQRISDPHLRGLAQKWEHQALHAAALGLSHPRTGAPLSFYAPPPQMLVDLYEALTYPPAKA